MVHYVIQTETQCNNTIKAINILCHKYGLQQQIYIYIKYVEHLIIYYYLENKTNFYKSTIDYKSLNDEILALRYDQKLLLMQ